MPACLPACLCVSVSWSQVGAMAPARRCSGSCSAAAAVALMATAISMLAFFFRSEEARLSSASRLDYRSRSGWIRECAQWDPSASRFMVSFMEGGLGQVKLPSGDHSGTVAQEEILVEDAELAGNATLGFKIDHARDRVIVTVADPFRNKYSAVAAYSMQTWQRIFLTRLAGPERLSFADDVAFDPEGNSYVTDAIGGLIWKVSPDGSEKSILTDSPLFKLKAKNIVLGVVSLNGIVYHPDGYLLVSHTGGKALFKVSKDGKEVRKVEMEQDVIGDGIAMVTPGRLAVAGLWSGVSMLESSNGWLTANVTHHYASPKHRMASSVTVKDDRVFVNYILGFGRPYTLTINEAAFVPSSRS